MTIRKKIQQIARSLADKTYSEEFVKAEVATTAPFQIRAMRKERKWTQADLAAKTGQYQKTISDFENPDIGPQSIASLQRIAAAFDVGLIVRFAPFSELVEWSANMSKQSHFVPNRTNDIKLRAQQNGRPMKAEVSTFIQAELDFAEIGSTSNRVIDMTQWKTREIKPTVINSPTIPVDPMPVSVAATEARIIWTAR